MAFALMQVQTLLHPQCLILQCFGGDRGTIIVFFFFLFWAPQHQVLQFSCFCLGGREGIKHIDLFHYISIVLAIHAIRKPPSRKEKKKPSLRHSALIPPHSFYTHDVASAFNFRGIRSSVGQLDLSTSSHCCGVPIYLHTLRRAAVPIQQPIRCFFSVGVFGGIHFCQVTPARHD